MRISLVIAFFVGLSGCGKSPEPTVESKTPEVKKPALKPVTPNSKPTKPIPTSAIQPKNASWNDVYTKCKQLAADRLITGKATAEKNVSRLPQGERLQAELYLTNLDMDNDKDVRIEIMLELVGSCRDYVRALAVQHVIADKEWITLAKKIWEKRRTIIDTPEAISKEADWLYSLSVSPGLCNHLLRAELYSGVSDVLEGQKPTVILRDRESDLLKAIVKEIP